MVSGFVGEAVGPSNVPGGYRVTGRAAARVRSHARDGAQLMSRSATPSGKVHRQPLRHQGGLGFALHLDGDLDLDQDLALSLLGTK